MQQIVKIVITGGPCAGKSTAMSWIQNHFSEKGWTVLFVPETATELITGGVAPWTCGTNADYQKCQMGLQLAKEKIFEKAAATMDAEKALIVCDRGALDNRAYMDELEFSQVLADVGATEVELRDSYDAVFHLVTAADGALAHYTTDNNGARTETPEEAIALDRRTCAAWDAHPHRRIFGNHCDFRSKISGLIDAVEEFLAHRAPSEP